MSDKNGLGHLEFQLQVGADNLSSNRISVTIHSISASALGVGWSTDGTNAVSAHDAVNTYHYGLNDSGSVVKITGNDLASISYA